MPSEMEQMKNDEREHDQPAHDHVTGCPGSFDVFFPEIMVGPGAAILDRELDSEINVKNDRQQKEASNYPKERSEVPQMLRVAINPVRPEINLQVPQEMADDEQDQN